jgi:hypothetical protein
MSIDKLIIKYADPLIDGLINEFEKTINQILSDNKDIDLAEANSLFSSVLLTGILNALYVFSNEDKDGFRRQLVQLSLELLKIADKSQDTKS